MVIMSAGGLRRVAQLTATIPMLAAALFLAGCAPVASKSAATSPSAVLLQQSPAESGTTGSSEGVVDGAPPEDTEATGSDAITAEVGDAQPAEEVTPSPLDSLPAPPEIPPAVVEQDKRLFEDGFAGFDIPMVLNDKVSAYVEYFKGQHHELFAAGLVRSGKYVARFQEVFEQAGLPKDLVFMAHVESAFKTNAYSRAKAKGIFQFIAETGRRYGLRIDSWVDERSDPEKSASAAAAYLKDLYGMFGDWYLALAAYNAGEGKIQRALAQTKKSDFWSLCSTRSLRAETKNYVPAILAATLIAKHPDKFDFDVQLEAPAASDVVKIEGQTDLRILAKLADVDAETMRQLNPQLRRGMTPPGATTNVRVPSGLGEAVSQAYANLPVADRLVLARHQVGKGDSLGTIAQQYGVSASAIATANRLGKSATVKPGQELVIPAVSPAVKDGDGSRTGSVTYKVRKGDTLFEIAGHYRTTAAAIASASGISVHANLSVGQRLVVPARGGGASHETAAKSQASKSKAEHDAVASSLVHTVRRGETLYRIADQYQVTVDQICTLNRISPDGVLYPGTRLTIRSN
jgi:membrane-bound lytic murein transglycosylase D